jgi:hypothetical protein
MERAFRIPVLAGMILMTAALAAYTEAPPQPQPTPETEDVSQPIPPTAMPEPTPGWADILGLISAPEGWQVEPCVNPSLLCVEAEGDVVGTVERFSYPLSEVQLATPVNPEESELEFLRAWVAEFYESIERDRTIADRALVFTGESPTEIAIGELPGLRYSYVTTHPDGTLFERSVGYVTIDGDMIHVFTSGLINGDYAGTFSDDASLSAFEPHLDDIMRGLSL